MSYRTRRSPQIKVCFHCGVTIHVKRVGKHFQNCQIIKSLFRQKNMYYEFFEIDESREIDTQTCYLCLRCHSLVMTLTVPKTKVKYGEMPRKFKRLPNSGKTITMGLVRLCDTVQTCCESSADISAEHNYAEPIPEQMYESEIVLNQLSPGYYDVKRNCFNCGKLCERKKKYTCIIFKFLHELLSPEDCEATFELGSELTAAQRRIFPEARLCMTCVEFVKRKTQPGYAIAETEERNPPPWEITDANIAETKERNPPPWEITDANIAETEETNPPPWEITDPNVNIAGRRRRKGDTLARTVFRKVKMYHFKSAFRTMINGSQSARRAFKQIVCQELRTEIRKYFKVPTVFTREMTFDNLTWFSLEEAGLAAHDISPFIVDVLKALLPEPVQRNGSPFLHYPTVKDAETAINSRLGLTLSVLLYTHMPQKFKYIQSCIGTKLWQADISQTSLEWLHQVGISLSRQAIRRHSKKLMEGVRRELQPTGKGEPDPVNQPEPSVIPDPMPASPVSSTPGTMMTPANPTTSEELGKPTHRSNGSHMCNICGQSFRLKVSMICHKRSHSKARPYLCKLCGKAFKCMGNVLNHTCRPKLAQMPANSHWTPRQLAARQCMRRVVERSTNTSKHRKRQTNMTVPRVKFKSLFVPEKKEDKELPCQVCGKIFTQLGCFKRHMKVIHAADRPHMCHVCLKTFSCENLLKNHIHVHNRHRKVQPNPVNQPKPSVIPDTIPAGPVSSTPGTMMTPSNPTTSDELGKPTNRSNPRESPVHVAKKKTRKRRRPLTTWSDRRKRHFKKVTIQPTEALSSDLANPVNPTGKTGETNQTRPPAKKRKKSSKTPSNQVKECSAASVEFDPGIMNSSAVPQNLNQSSSSNWDDMAESTVNNEAEAVGAQSLLHQLGGLSDPSEVAQLVPVGMLTEDGLITLDGVIDWSVMNDPT